jgi:hypothetical protein
MRIFTISRGSWITYSFLVGIAVLPAIGLYQELSTERSANIYGWLLGLLLCILLIEIHAAVRTRLEIGEKRISIKGSLFGRTLPMSALNLDRAGVVDLDASDVISARKFGVGAPGFSEGWYRLVGGRTGLLFVTRRTAVVRIPTWDNYDIFFSTSQPEALLQSLRSLQPPNSPS